MLFGKREKNDPDKFWIEYEEKIQEKVLAKSLGRYLSGWAEYEGPMWGLVIATTGGVRFHHFPHEGWIMALTRVTSGGEPPKEKTIFIPKERIVSVELHIEKRWWKRLLSPSLPLLKVLYTNGAEESEMLIETEMNAKEVSDALEETLKLKSDNP
jgi:hypothetical protein